MVQTKQELIDLINKNRETILSFGINRLGVFGSFARNEQNEKSDVDFLVVYDYKNVNMKKYVGLFDYLEALTGRQVDIASPNSLAPHRAKKILPQTEYVL